MKNETVKELFERGRKTAAAEDAQLAKAVSPTLMVYPVYGFPGSSTDPLSPSGQEFKKEFLQWAQEKRIERGYSTPDEEASFWVRAVLDEIKERSWAHGEINFRFEELRKEFFGQ